MKSVLSAVGGLLCRHAGFLVLALAAGVLANRFYIGPAFNDDFGYIDFAASISLNGIFVEAPMAVRNALVLPLAGAFRLFGVNNTAVHVLTTGFVEFALLAVYVLGVEILDRRTALLAAASLTVFPLAAQFATQIVADFPALILNALVVLLFLRAGALDGVQDRKRTWLYLCAGLLIGLSYLGKTTSILLLLLPFFEALVMLWRRRVISWKGLACLGGFLTVWSAEGLLYWRLFGDFLYHYHAERWYYTNEAFLKNGRLADLTMYPRLMFLFQSWRDTYPFGCFMHLCVLGLVWALWRGNRQLRLIAAWWLIIFLYHEFGTMSITDYILVDRQARYLLMLAVPTVLLNASLMMSLLRARRLWAKGCGAFLLAAQFLCGAACSVHAVWMDRNGVQDSADLWSALQALRPLKTIWVDHDEIQRLVFLDGDVQRSRDYQILSNRPECAALAGSYVVFDTLHCIGEVNRRPVLGECMRRLWLLKEIDNPLQIGGFSSYNPQVLYAAGDDDLAALSTSAQRRIVLNPGEAAEVSGMSLGKAGDEAAATPLLVAAPGALVSVEFNVTIPEEGDYILFSRYAASVSHPLEIWIDGELVTRAGLWSSADGAAAQSVREWPEALVWLAAGKHVLSVHSGAIAGAPQIAGFSFVGFEPSGAAASPGRPRALMRFAPKG